MNPYKRHAADADPYIEHAERELKLLGLYDGDPMNASAAEDVLALLRVLSSQGHSGFSVGYVLSVFNKLAKFDPLTPLTGADDEWNDITAMWGAEPGCRQYQNTRSSRVFKIVEADGTEKCYDIEGIVFEEPSGVRFMNSESSVPVEFPYTPSTRVVQVPKSARTATIADAVVVTKTHPAYWINR